MAILTRSVTADSSGNGTVTIAEVPTGIQWVVSQVGIETVPAGTAVPAVIRLNGRFVTSSANASSDAAQGPPYITINPGDQLTITWSGAPSRCSLIANIYLTEYPYGQINPNAQVV